MRRASHFHICPGKDGLWNVIDSSTGGLADLEINDTIVKLHSLTEDVAQALSDWLNEKWDYSAENPTEIG